jgi:hypothetical protein
MACGVKRAFNNITYNDSDSDDYDSSNKPVFIPKRVCFSNYSEIISYPTIPPSLSPPPLSPKLEIKPENYNVISHVSNDVEKIEFLEKKMESLNLKSAQMLIDCIQSLLESINEKIEKTKEYIELNNFNPDYCVDNNLITLFKEIEQIKNFQTEANSLLTELLVR